VEAEAHAEIDRLQGQLKALQGKANTTTPASKDNFQQIGGIGPTYAKRLHQAGVTTFAALAALTPDRVQEIVAAKVGLKVKPEDWIAEAARLAKEQNS
jgi:predicted flap endonuclease-1-like 5' DNA nuclease